MAQASFFVNYVKIVQAEEGFIIEGQRTCPGGNVVDQVHLLMPDDLKAAFKQWLEEDLDQTKTPHAPTPSSWLKGRFSTN